jgi:hypothetical protein
MISASLVTVHAYNFRHDFGDTAEINSSGTNVFAYDIGQNMQTEPNGGWITGNTYQVNWTIRLDYVNQDIVNGNSYILFYLPSPLSTEPACVTQIVINQTQLSLTQKTGTLSAAFTAGNATGYFFGLNLKCALYVNGVIYNGTLRTDVPQDATFSTDVLNNEAPSQTTAAPEFPSMLIVLIVIALSLSVAIAVIRRNRKWQTNSG